jgi:hypothetical protein
MGKKIFKVTIVVFAIIGIYATYKSIRAKGGVLKATGLKK